MNGKGAADVFGGDDLRQRIRRELVTLTFFDHITFLLTCTLG